MRAVIALIFSTVLCSCAATTQIPSAKAVMLTDAQITSVEAGVRRNLKDPESARFGSFRAGADATGKIGVCGTVNARNGFGGYTGDKMFVGEFRGDFFTLRAFGGDQFANLVANQECRSLGL
jgi:hypothetical protein